MSKIISATIFFGALFASTQSWAGNASVCVLKAKTTTQYELMCDGVNRLEEYGAPHYTLILQNLINAGYTIGGQSMYQQFDTLVYTLVKK
jgi:hypothetical protein